MEPINELLQPGDGLLLVDVQNDFCSGGALPVPDGDAVVPVLNRWIGAAISRGLKVYASRDWHPFGHMSFSEYGGPWPVHCLQDTHGARFHPGLRLPVSVVKITKGVRFDHDQNSAFDETGLAMQLRKDHIRRIWVGGLAEDVCVQATVFDALKEGFEVVLIEDATRPVTAEGGAEARQKTLEAGATAQTTPSNGQGGD